MNPLAKLLFVTAVLSAAGPAEAARPVKARINTLQKASFGKALIVRRSLGADRKAYDSVFDQRRRYLDQQEAAAWNRYNAVRESDERRINAHYVTSGQWLSQSPCVGEAYEAYRKARDTPRP